MSALFGQKPTYENFLKDIDLKKTDISFSTNKDEYRSQQINRILNLESTKVRSLALALESEKNCYLNEKKIDFELGPINSIFDHILKHLIDFSIELNTPVPLLESDRNQEARGLEWIKVSLVVLKNALGEIEKNHDYIFQSRIFWRNSPFPSLRIQCLSLDIILEFHEDHRLRVRVWNYKDGVKTSSDKEDFLGDFVHLKGPVLDEVIQLFSELRPHIILY